jgi:integrase
MKLKLEDKLLRALAEGDYHDTLVPRLTLRVRSRSRRWVVRYRLPGQPPLRFVLGDARVLSLAEARAHARRTLALVDRGEDPLELRRAKREAENQRRLGERVDAAVDSWLADSKLGPAARWKGGLGGGTARSFLPHVRRLKRDLGDRRLVDLTPLELERFVSAPDSPATRNRALTALRLFLAWAKRKGLLQTDPTAALPKERETERTRVLNENEIRGLVRGFDGTGYGRAVRLLFLTGLRRDEILGLKWDWLDTEAATLTIPAEAEKAGRSRGELRRVALSQEALSLLVEQRQALFANGVRSGYAFATATGARPHGDALKPILYRLRGRRSNGLPASTDKRAKRREVVLPDDVTIHDIRRTVADALLNRVKAAPWIVDHVILGHVRPKLLRTYMPTLPLKEAREALEGWADELTRILGERARPDTKSS